MKRFLAAILLVGLVVFVPSCKQKEPHVAPKPAKTGIATLRFYDTDRERPLITEVWYPVDEEASADPVEGLWVRCAEARDAPLKEGGGKTYPLIVMSHGSWSDRLNNSWMAETLVANGYIVVSADHYGNTWNNKIPECFVKLWDRPQDVTFVLDQILQDEKFGPHIDQNKIGFVGYSLGGMTGIWIAGGKVSFDKPQLQALPKEHVPSSLNEEIINSIDFSPAELSYHDPRISAVFVMAPALGYLFEVSSLEAISIPVHIVASAGDTIVPLDSSANILASKIKKAALVLISPSASHYVFLNEVTKGGKMLLDKKVVLDPPEVDRGKIHADLGVAAVRFFNRHLLEK